MKPVKLLGLLFVFLLDLANQIHAQSGPGVNEQMHTVLSHIKIQPPHNMDAEPFLYDMAGHTVRKERYAPMCTDTNSSRDFWAMYYETYYQSYMIGLTPYYGAVMDKADSLIHNDTIPIGILDYGYNIFVTGALAHPTGGPIIYNNDSAWIAPGQNPFALNSATGNYRWDVFTAAPLMDKTIFRDVTFRLKNNFIFYGSTYNLDPWLSSDSVQIDFGAGAGWQYVHLASNPAVNIVYPYKGTYYIQVRVLHDGVPIRYSISRFYVGSDDVRSLPDYWLTNISGLNIGVFLGCGHDSVVKPVIYLEGIDLLEQRHVPEIYAEMIHQPGLVMLRNSGYDFVVVDWQNSRIDMRTNAASVIALIRYLITKIHDTTQFVVIGESMGGVIGRYALTKMETTAYISGGTSPNPKSHNTRLFITIDAPQQGAIVPIAAQSAVDIIYAWPDVITHAAFILYDLFRNAQILSNNVLNQDAVKELLITHDAGRDIFTGTYADLTIKTDFWNELIGMNPSSHGYPVHCKKMALSNGLMDGKRQVGFDNQILGPGDKYMDLVLDVKLGIVQFFYFDLFQIPEYKLYAEPNGTGTYCSVTYNVNYPTLIGCLVNWFQGLSGCSSSFPVTFSLSATNMKPRETMAGGYYPSIGASFDSLTAGIPIGNFNFPDLFEDLNYTLDSATGHISFKYLIDVMLLNLSVTFSFDADIINFCFIPYYSSLDYQVPSDTGMAHDILHEGIDTILSRTPYDVLVGELDDSLAYPDLRYSNTQNYAHLNERNDPIFGNSSDYPKGYLQREIGDYEMDLDNLWINRAATFEASQTISAGNEESAFYAYVDHPTPLVNLGGGLFSKNNHFIDDSVGGDVQFKAGKEIRLEPGFEARQGSRFWAHIVTEDTCNYTLSHFTNSVKRPVMKLWPDPLDNGGNTTPVPAQPIFKVWPNPSASQFIVDMPSSPIAHAYIYNAMGMEIGNCDVSGQKQFIMDAAKYNMTNGMYLLVVYTKQKNYTEKLIVNH